MSKKIKYVKIIVDDVLFNLNKGVNYLEDKQVATVRTITGELIGGYILYGILFGILYSVIYSLISKMFSADSLIPTAIIAIILQGITTFCIWRCSIATTFRKRLIDRNDVQTVMKNLMIFTVIWCILSGLMNYSNVNEQIDQKINSNATLMLSETYMKYLYDDEEIAQYQAEKEKFISEAKTKLYTYLTVLEIGLIAIYLGAVPLQKKAILKYAV